LLPLSIHFHLPTSTISKKNLCFFYNSACGIGKSTLQKVVLIKYSGVGKTNNNYMKGIMGRIILKIIIVKIAYNREHKS
jgi:hypothetical protein